MSLALLPHCRTLVVQHNPHKEPWARFLTVEEWEAHTRRSDTDLAILRWADSPAGRAAAVAADDLWTITWVSVRYREKVAVAAATWDAALATAFEVEQDGEQDPV